MSVPRLVLRAVAPALLLATVVGLSWRATRPVANYDTFMHLRFGDEFRESWSISDPGSVSTFATADWVPTQWLPEVFMSWLEGQWGLPAIAALTAVTLLGLVTALYAVARRWAEPEVSAAIVVVVMLVCGPWLSMRPQVFSYLFVGVTVHAWYSVRESGRTPWLLVPLTWVWAMTHGMWPVGVVVGFVAACALMADEGSVGRRSMARLAVPGLSLVAACLTPVGPRLVGQVFAVTERASFFKEWGPPDFGNLDALLLALLLGVTVTALLRSPETVGWTEVALLALASGSALWSARTLPVAAVLVVPMAARALQIHVGERPRASTGERRLVAGIAITAVAACCAVAPATADAPGGDDPEWLDARLSGLPAGTPILSEWGYTGYVMWRYPQLDPVMHGYGDTFTIAELQRNTIMRAAGPEWDHLVDDTDARVAVLVRESPLAYGLESQGWTVVEESGPMALLEAPAA